MPFRCTSTPPRTYSKEGICPPTPGRKECKGCTFWKDAGEPTIPGDPATDLSAFEEALSEPVATLEEQKRVCRVCGCTETTPCIHEEYGGIPCGWLDEEQTLCSACVTFSCDRPGDNCPHEKVMGMPAPRDPHYPSCWGCEHLRWEAKTLEQLSPEAQINAAVNKGDMEGALTAAGAVLVADYSEKEPAQEEAEPVQVAEAQAWKPRCPFLGVLGEEYIQCQDSDCRILGKREFDSKKVCRNKADSHCFDRFLDCQHYRKYYNASTEEKACIHCCNNSWNTGLLAGYDGGKWCFCQLKQKPMAHKDSCEWFNRHPEWKLEGAASSAAIDNDAFDAAVDLAVKEGFIQEEYPEDEQEEAVPDPVKALIGRSLFNSRGQGGTVKDVLCLPGSDYSIIYEDAKTGHEYRFIVRLQDGLLLEFDGHSSSEPLSLDYPRPAQDAQETVIETPETVIKTAPIVSETTPIVKENTGTGYSMIDINLLYPNPANPRKRFDQEEMDRLTESIKAVGILEPLLVVDRLAAKIKEGGGQIEEFYELCKREGRYRIVAGERRWRGAQAAGLQEVPVIVRDLTPDQEFEVMLTENIQRQDLDPIEEANAFKAAIDRGWKQTELAAKLGVSQPYIANRLRLLELPETVQVNISREIMPPSQALLLVKVANNAELIEKLAKDLEGVPVAKSEETIESILRNRLYSTPLFLGGYNKPKFDPTAEGCDTCPNRVMVKEYGGKKQRPHCMDPKCWSAKQKAVEKEEIQQNITAALGDGAPSDLPYLRDLDGNSYERFWNSKPDECEECEKIRPVLGYDNQVEYVCMDPGCMKRKHEQAQQEHKEALKREKQAWDERIQSLARTGLDEVLEPAALLFLALRTITLAEENGYYVGSKCPLEFVCDRFGWEMPSEDEADDEEKQTAWLFGKLRELSDEDIAEAAYVALLASINDEDWAYKLTLGAVAGDEDGEGATGENGDLQAAEA